MYNKAAGKRWLIVDEISTAASYVSGVMEKNVRKARQGTEFSMDAAGEERDWGGVNLIVGGDWLQLPPVRAKSIFRNPFLKGYVSVERHILNMFWPLEDVKGIPSSPDLLFELTEPLRSRDLWLNMSSPAKG